MKTFLRIVVVKLLTLEAQFILKKYQPEIIAVTGSVGKTSTKDAVATALGSSSVIRKSMKSQNSNIGVPLSIIGADNQWESVVGWLRVLAHGFFVAFGNVIYPKTLILEVGTDHPGDITSIASWLKPDTVVVTGVPDIPAHIAFFHSADAVLNEKAELVRHMRGGGTLIINGDNERTRTLIHNHYGRVISYGLKEGSDLIATHIEPIITEKSVTGGETLLRYRGMRFRINHKVTSVPCEIHGTIGEPSVLSVLAGCAVALARGVDLVNSTQQFKNHVSAPGRMRILDGVGDTTIIDDSYNSSPIAALAALDILQLLPVRGRRIAVLGDMRELGIKSKEAHELVGKRVADVADLLITVGEESYILADAALTAGMKLENIKSYGYGESKRAGADMAKQLHAGDVILVKGSQNMIRMEHFVKEIVAEPNRAKELLVRQEDEWLLKT